MNKSTTNAGNSAVLYKDQGNVHLSNGRYEEAASSYTKGSVNINIVSMMYDTDMEFND